MSSKEMKSSALAAGACPGDYNYIAAGDFCIEKDLHDPAGVKLLWEDAAMACVEDDGAHLCKASEWAQACNLDANGIITLNDMGSQWEWVDDFSKKNEAFMVGHAGCEDYDIANPFNAGGHKEEYRCCKNIVK